MDLRLQPWNQKLFTLFGKARPNVVESDIHCHTTARSAWLMRRTQTSRITNLQVNSPQDPQEG